MKGLFYLRNENKNADQLRSYREADQLRSYREADLRLCFRICKMLVFSLRGSIIKIFFIVQKQVFWNKLND